MIKELWIRAISDDEQKFEYLVVENQTKMYAIAVQNVVSLLSKDRNAFSDVIFFIPTHDCLLTVLDMPDLPKRNRVEVLSFALEGYFLDELEKQHVVILGEPEPNRYAVAVVLHKKMQDFIEKLRILEIRPTVVLPDVFALPNNPDEHGVLVAEDRIRIPF